MTVGWSGSYMAMILTSDIAGASSSLEYFNSFLLLLFLFIYLLRGGRNDFCSDPLFSRPKVKKG